MCVLCWCSPVKVIPSVTACPVLPLALIPPIWQVKLSNRQPVCLCAQSKLSHQSPRVLPPLPSSVDNPDISRASPRTPRSSQFASESGVVVSMSASNSTEDNPVPAAAIKQPSANISKSSDGESLRVFLISYTISYRIITYWTFSSAYYTTKDHGCITALRVDTKYTARSD